MSITSSNLPPQDGSTFQRFKDQASKQFGDINQVPLLPRIIKESSVRIPNTKGVRACSLRTRGTEKFLVAALPTEVVVLCWSQVRHKFLEIKRLNFEANRITRIASAGINLIIKEDKELPICCLNVWKERHDFVPRLGQRNNSEPKKLKNNDYKLHTFDLNNAEEKNPLPDVNEPLRPDKS